MDREAAGVGGGDGDSGGALGDGGQGDFATVRSGGGRFRVRSRGRVGQRIPVGVREVVRDVEGGRIALEQFETRNGVDGERSAVRDGDLEGLRGREAAGVGGGYGDGGGALGDGSQGDLATVRGGRWPFPGPKSWPRRTAYPRRSP